MMVFILYIFYFLNKYVHKLHSCDLSILCIKGVAKKHFIIFIKIWKFVICTELISALGYAAQEGCGGEASTPPCGGAWCRRRAQEPLLFSIIDAADIILLCSHDALFDAYYHEIEVQKLLPTHPLCLTVRKFISELITRLSVSPLCRLSMHMELLLATGRILA